MVYSFAMKYVALLVIIIMFVRIDVLLEFYEKATGKFQPAPPEISESDIKSNRETIPMAKDENLKQTSKERFFSLLEDFHTSPTAEMRERVLTALKSNPTMFSADLDAGLESHIFRFRDLMINNNDEMVFLLIELMNVLPGQNQEMIKRFFSLWMDINMEHFIAAYSRTKDVNCTIAGTFGDNIPEEEKINEYYDREDALKAFISKEGVNIMQKNFAEKCLLVLGMEIQKRAPQTGSETVAPEATEGTVP